MPPANDVLERLAQAESEGLISASAAANIRRWLTEPPFEKYRPRLLEDIEAGRWKTLDDAFYAVLEFGTGGRRGKMYPVGTNVLNERTMAESARGLADYIIKRKGIDSSRSCVIARDTRHNSPEFAQLCARVLAAAGFKVYLFAEPRSTPLLSFAVRHLKCDAGIMITASHNAPSDNGFKCYAANGGQVIPPDDEGIIDCVREASDREIPETPFEKGIADGSIVLGGADVDDGYIAAVVGESVSPARDLSIVYTPMHGVGETSVAAALSKAGFTQVNILASQRTPDGDFPNIPGHVSNPEIPKTLEASIAEAKATGAELVLGSDPDADRIGVAVPVSGDPKGAWTTLDGNKIGALLAAFVMKQTKAMGRLRSDHYLVTTMVTTQMARALAQREGVRVEDDLLVGFKWIGQRIDEMGPAGFLFGFEESHGYLKGTHVRDKDAAVAALLFAELAATVKDRKQTILEYLDDLYRDVGHFAETLINKTLEGREGATQIKTLMTAFRENPPRQLGGVELAEVYDYKTHEIRSVSGTEKPRPLPQPSGDLLIFHTQEPGTRVAVRPSGTEPKIKFYLFARTDTSGTEPLERIKEKTFQRLDGISKAIEQYIQDVLKT
ncbi:phospho-sugar mutase [Singulisphaera acidiphila]|uniref:Phosphomannomutase n=1 Tax=Singulisphaera acidiphila (strain ATCC BAA-1392 / DSM 18658 / VKM B-2454 / MOB10) TaxID=886293 RepID=L0DKP9_SINAD|nr:phospho-sugar mutase [Singulisphaera acidiphila]AGA29949.1 phosphomannomutase [Singulisphaera acidiphila DSM 18658]